MYVIRGRNSIDGFNLYESYNKYYMGSSKLICVDLVFVEVLLMW